MQEPFYPFVDLRGGVMFIEAGIAAAIVNLKHYFYILQKMWLNVSVQFNTVIWPFVKNTDCYAGAYPTSPVSLTVQFLVAFPVE